MQRGDVVRLNGSDYPFMTVEDVVPTNAKGENYNDVYCVWFLDNYDVVREVFPDYVLNKYECL